MISCLRQAVRESELPLGEASRWLGAVPRLEEVASFLVSPKDPSEQSSPSVHLGTDLHPAIRDPLHQQIGSGVTSTMEKATSAALLVSQDEGDSSCPWDDFPSSVVRVAVFSFELPTILGIGDKAGGCVLRLMRELAARGLVQSDILAMSKLLAKRPPETPTRPPKRRYGRFTVSSNLVFAGALACLVGPLLQPTSPLEDGSTRDALTALLCADASLVSRGAHRGFGTIVLAEATDEES